MPRDLNVTSFPILKGATQTLFAALTNTVSAALTPSINMVGYFGGSLEVLVTGDGAISFQVLTSEDNLTFVPAYAYAATPTVLPPIVTTTAISASFQISGIRARYLKLVPTVSGLGTTPNFSAAVYFTPATV